ncbi:MAG: T9SS type A sorting domain-containing protein [Bacteroidales bacterium]|nr:T9SS type A sorting domain-containing protein [Bacteroidales bacterium]MCF8456873.1 T9SS type A sorting domain-containing protein [Bacteroidales bacterium]
MKLNRLIIVTMLLWGSNLFAQTWTSFTTSNSPIPFNKMYSMDIDTAGKVWVGTDVSGANNHIACFDGSSWTGWFTNGWINGLSADNSGNVWTSINGDLQKWNGSTWTAYSPTSATLSWWAGPLYAAPDGSVWIKNDASLLRFQGNTWTEYTTANSGLPSTNITAFADNGTNLYIATSDQGYAIFNGSTFTHVYTGNSDLPADGIQAMSYRDNLLWLVCSGGRLVKVAGNVFTVFLNINLAHASDLAIDGNGDVWISTNGEGLVHFDGQDFEVIDNTVQPLIDIYNQLLSIEVDATDAVWIGNRSSGLVKYEPGNSNLIPGDTVKIFFLGNSFMGANNLPGIVEDLATLAGEPHFIDSHTPGGQFSTNFITDPFVYEKFRSQDWDYVVIQDNQGAYVNSPPYVNPTYLNANFQLYDSIKANNSCSRVVWFAGWAYEGGLPQYFPGDNTISCINRILDNVVYQNSFVDEIVAPIGEGWIKSLTEQPTIDLFSPDSVHPSEAGSVVTAAVLYSILFKSNPGLINYTGNLPIADAQYLLQAGYDVVVDADNFIEYNLAMYSPQITFFNNMVQVPDSFSYYLWMKDQGPISSATLPIIEFQGPGNYSVFVVDLDGCPQESFQVYFEAGPFADFSYTTNDAEVLFTNLSSNSTSYEWDFGDGQTSILENPLHEYTSTGNYIVVLTAWNQYGGADHSDTIAVQVTAVESIENRDCLILDSNPATNFVLIRNIGNQPISNIQMFDIKGEILLRSNEIIQTGNQSQIELSSLSAGVYIIRYIKGAITLAQKLIIY